MLIKGTKKYNLRHNTERTEQVPFGEMINGQALGRVSKYRYGLCPMSFNGCEVIAVHNALVYLNKPRPLGEIAFYMERFKSLFGIFGCNPYKIGKALANFGANHVRTKNADGAEAFIVTFWTKIPFLSSIHTVFCVRNDKGITVYNRANRCPGTRTYGKIEDFIGKRKPITLYIIEKDNPMSCNI